MACLALAVDLAHNHTHFTSTTECVDQLHQHLEHLQSSRPTAVNLFEATDRLRQHVGQLLSSSPSVAQLVKEVIDFAERLFEQDVKDNRAIGRSGGDWLIEQCAGRGIEKSAIRVLTHCNTGSLATAGYGTALGRDSIFIKTPPSKPISSWPSCLLISSWLSIST